MILTRAGQSSTNALFQLVWRQSSVRFDDAPFAMHPLGFNRVEPRALDRQRTNEDPCALTGFQTGLIMRTDPLLHRTADVPTGIVPHQNQNPLALSQHHCRNWVVMPLIGRPSTNRSHISSTHASAWSGQCRNSMP